MDSKSKLCVTLLTGVILVAAFSNSFAQNKFTIEQILSPAFPFELVSAKNVDRIAWIEYERGMRNVYTAVPPDFEPVRLTNNMEDDGNDLSSLRISDDGSVIAYVRGHAPNRDGWIANPSSLTIGSERAIWAVSTSGGEPGKLAIGNNPVLSPDGKWALFTRNGQIYRVKTDQTGYLSEIDKGEQPLFRGYGNNSNPRWSPDGKKIAFASSRGGHSYIGVYEPGNPKITYIAPGVDRDTSPTWSEDGKQIAFIRRPGLPFGIQGGTGGRQGRGRQGGPPPGGRGRRGGFSDEPPPDRPGLTNSAFSGGYTFSLWVGDVGTATAKEFWHNAPGDTIFAAIRSIEWAGENVISRVERNNWRHYYTFPLSGGSREPVNLTPGEGIAEAVGLSSDGKYLFYSTNVGDIDRRNLWKTPTKGGKSEQLTEGDGIEMSPAALASGNTVAVLYADAKRPQSVAVVSANGGKARIISADLPAGFPLEDQVVPENVMLTAPDGLEFHNQVFVPKDIRPGEKRPAMLFTHGGPSRQMLLGYHYMHFYHMAYALNQYFANQGYIVISVNYRSGIGYGREFRTAANRGSRGNSEYQDVETAGKYLQNRPDVDVERIGLWGLSYGGLLTAQGLARNSDIFAAGVDLAGVHLWGSSINPTSVSYQSSPISEIENWRSPVLLIHGDDDRNVAFSQTTGLVQLLRANNVYHELIVFPDDVHDSLLYYRWLFSFNAADDFFKRFIINK